VAIVCAPAATCAGRAAVRDPGPAALHTSCAPETTWDGRACAARGDGAVLLARAAAALAGFRVDDALALLEQARERGPHRHVDHILLYEQLGIAYAYLGRESEAMDAFAMLLVLDPGHLLSYTLSPQATFLFERARSESAAQPRPTVDVSWPRDLEVTRPVPLDVETIADPRALLERATLHVRIRGESGFRELELPLAAVGAYQRVLLPPVAATAPRVIELYLTATDARGNEVLTWADPTRPREIALAYHAPVPWTRKWWVWALAGGVLAAGTGATVYLLGREPPDTVGGAFDVAR
jgi:hypothetical protein